MLPENEFARVSYVEMRDARSRDRQMMIKGVAGDLDAFNATARSRMAIDAELSDLRESVDFAIAEGGILTPEMEYAANAAISWGMELKKLIEAAK